MGCAVGIEALWQVRIGMRKIATSAYRFGRSALCFCAGIWYNIASGTQPHKRIQISGESVSQAHPQCCGLSAGPGSHRRIQFRAFSPLVRIPVSPLLTMGFSDFSDFFQRLAYHRVSRGLYRNICPCRRRNEYIMNGRFSYEKYGDKPCQKWACLRSFLVCVCVYLLAT